ncbi:MAG: hypothetical protein D8M57_10605 [Candidatus Scalindua sp. AMX11]|nr:MAG: hypothetical protein DWQ00_03400 [Candidatus Scalindua sp.]TDE64899.1 MAG: hypothetical protein D8M57_10605 [Candidatus Scalindua sp. AMX11]GJQ60367.1 MAG: hypothetical protein SCALA701_31680 [Candidatus Scalindua sp.]
MIKERLQEFLGDMEGTMSFTEYISMLSTEVIRFPDNVTLPQNPNNSYGSGWEHKFSLPKSPIGIEDSKSLIILEDTKANASSIETERKSCSYSHFHVLCFQ